MQAYRSDRVVRVLTIFVSVVYFMMWTGAALALVGIPVARISAGTDTDLTVALGEVEVELPQAMLDSAAAVRTRWGLAQLDLQDLRADLEVPIGRLPWGVVALIWIQIAAGCSLMLFVLHHLRRIFQRVRDGVPFDANNALRLRWLGVSLLALAVFSAIANLLRSLALRDWVENSGLAVPVGFTIDTPTVFAALVLIALAEIFRRGAELEHEQSLVV
jgi:hypothetical protein